MHRSTSRARRRRSRIPSSTCRAGRHTPAGVVRHDPKVVAVTGAGAGSPVASRYPRPSFSVCRRARPEGIETTAPCPSSGAGSEAERLRSEASMIALPSSRAGDDSDLDPEAAQASRPTVRLDAASLRSSNAQVPDCSSLTQVVWVRYARRGRSARAYGVKTMPARIRASRSSRRRAPAAASLLLESRPRR